MPDGYDEQVIKDTGLELLAKEDTTESVAAITAGWLKARASREEMLCRLEGDAVFEAQQQIYTVEERIAREHRLSRFNFLARKPA